jgi:hypothetical protein
MKKWSKDWEGKGAPWIVCAANLYGEVLVVGPRHCDSVMRRQIDVLDANAFLKDCYPWKSETREIQGFIDQFGDFYNRQEAWKIAAANGQIIKRCGGDTANGGTLFSENLY